MRELTRTVIAAATVGAVIVLLQPVAATAAGDLVTLVDRDSDAKAQVSGGDLHVGDGSGRLTVDGQVRTGPAGDPVRLMFADTTSSGVLLVTPSYTVPAGYQLVITRVSGYVQVPSGQSVPVMQLRESTDPVGPGTSTAQFLEVGSTGTNVSGARVLTYSEELTLTVPAGTSISFIGSRNSNSGPAETEMTVSGSLVRA